jgi:LCP family protein required for cell wall assembly
VGRAGTRGGWTVSDPREPRGLPPEFDPRRGSAGRPGGDPGSRGGDPRGGASGPRGGGYPGQPGGYAGSRGGSAGYPGSRGGPAGQPSARDGYAGSRGGPSGNRPSGNRPSGNRLSGNRLPPDIDPRGRRAGAYSPDGLAGYDGPAAPPPAPPPAGRPPGGNPRGRHPFLRAVQFAAAFLSVLVLVASGVMWFLYRDFTTKVDRVNAIGATRNDVDGKDMNILLVGSDDRTNATPEELKELSTTDAVTNSTDTMILVHIPADGRKATAVSFPRDSYVTIPGCGQHKLNSAYINGATDCGRTKADPDKGRQKLVETISDLSGVKIDHYVEVDLLGFYRITKAIGGVQVCLNAAQKDSFSGIDLPKGTSTIEGKQAVAFIRQRHGLPRGDLDRIVRQQYFMSAVFRKVTSLGTLTNPIKLKRLLDAIGTSLRMDNSLDPLQLAGQLRGLAAGNVTFTTIPTEGNGRRDGQDVVVVDESAIASFFTSVIDPPKPKTPVKAAARGATTVAVYNGSGKSGLAATAAAALTKAGFKAGSAGNADSQTYTRTEIRYGADGEAQARAVLAVIPTAKLVQRSSVTSGVQLVLGSDFSSLGGSGASKAPAASASPKAPGDSRTAADAGCVN